jgi:hypothetical protein
MQMVQCGKLLKAGKGREGFGSKALTEEHGYDNTAALAHWELFQSSDLRTLTQYICTILSH